MAKVKLNVDNQSYEIQYNRPLVCHIERSKEARKDQLREFIYAKLQKQWSQQPKAVTTLERQYLKELINSL